MQDIIQSDVVQDLILHADVKVTEISNLVNSFIIASPNLQITNHR